MGEVQALAAPRVSGATVSGDVIDMDEARAKLSSLNVIRGDRPGGPRNFCKHRNVAVYEDEYRVECSDLEAPLDAHQVLLGFAREERSFRFAERRALSQLAKLTEEIEELKRVERNARARVRRLDDNLKQGDHK